MNVKIGRRTLQIIWWYSSRQCWGRWRWPSEETRAKFPRDDFGFHGWNFGPVEFRYWPNNQSRLADNKAKRTIDAATD